MGLNGALTRTGALDVELALPGRSPIGWSASPADDAGPALSEPILHAGSCRIGPASARIGLRLDRRFTTIHVTHPTTVEKTCAARAEVRRAPII